MSNRFEALFKHVTIVPDDSPESKSLKQAIMLQALRAKFDLSGAKLREMAYYMIHEMEVGLSRPVSDGASTLRMLPSYVYRENANIKGTFFALDLGGTNFRVIRMVVDNGTITNIEQHAFRIPAEHMRGTSEGLFGFIAESIASFFTSIKCVPTGKEKLGFTFSFPINQTGINQATLIAWTKGFSTEGVVGKDVCKLLQDALDSKKLPLEVVAICNDTVGTLVTRYFKDPNTEMGVILGTGCNGCYWERSNNITKEPETVRGNKEMIINMEFGNFDTKYLHVLPVTTFDLDIDADSINKGQQMFEKMISGMYLGEIARRILVALGRAGGLPRQFAEKLHQKKYVFTAKDCGEIAADKLPGLHFTEQTLRKNYGIDCKDERDRFVVREVCELVGKRSAQLAAAAIGATLLKSRKNSNATVAIDGSVFEKVPYYRKMLDEAIKQVVGTNAQVRCVLQKDGSGLGAGYISALTVAAKSKL